MTYKIEKELTVYNVEEVMKGIRNELDTHESGEGFILDLTDIEDIDTAGLQMLVSLQKYGDAGKCECRMLITEALKKTIYNIWCT